MYKFPCFHCSPALFWLLVLFSGMRILIKTPRSGPRRSAQSYFSSLDRADSNSKLISVADFFLLRSVWYFRVAGQSDLSYSIYISPYVLKIFSPPHIITWQRACMSPCFSEPTVRSCRLRGSQNMSGFAHIAYNELLIRRLEQLWLLCPSLFANSKPSTRIQVCVIRLLFLLLNDLL
jgi:hypothetical protein